MRHTEHTPALSGTYAAESAGAAAPNRHEIARAPMLRGNCFFFAPRAAPRLKISFLKHLCGETPFLEQPPAD